MGQRSNYSSNPRDFHLLVKVGKQKVKVTYIPLDESNPPKLINYSSQFTRLFIASNRKEKLFFFSWFLLFNTKNILLFTKLCVGWKNESVIKR